MTCAQKIVSRRSNTTHFDLVYSELTAPLTRPGDPQYILECLTHRYQLLGKVIKSVYKP